MLVLGTKSRSSEKPSALNCPAISSPNKKINICLLIIWESHIIHSILVISQSSQGHPLPHPSSPLPPPQKRKKGEKVHFVWSIYSLEHDQIPSGKAPKGGWAILTYICARSHQLRGAKQWPLQPWPPHEATDINMALGCIRTTDPLITCSDQESHHSIQWLHRPLTPAWLLRQQSLRTSLRLHISTWISGFIVVWGSSMNHQYQHIFR